MTTRKTRGAPGALAMLTLLLLLVVAPAARAADPDAPPDTADGWRKVIAYARCAFLVFAAATPTDTLSRPPGSLRRSSTRPVSSPCL